MYYLSLLSVALLLPFHPSCPILVCHALANNPKLKPKTYNYFAFGSNMASSIMINLRNISPLASSVAILPGHALRFNIPGVPGVEPSLAAVEPTNSDAVEKEQVAVHMVLYKLTKEDFATICQTEGVPLGYSLHRCLDIRMVEMERLLGKMNCVERCPCLPKEAVQKQHPQMKTITLSRQITNNSQETTWECQHSHYGQHERNGAKERTFHRVSPIWTCWFEVQRSLHWMNHIFRSWRIHLWEKLGLWMDSRRKCCVWRNNGRRVNISVLI